MKLQKSLLSSHVRTPVQLVAVMRQKVLFLDNQEDDDNNATQ